MRTPTDGAIFVQPPMYAYNMYVHRSAGTTLLDLVLTRNPKRITSSKPTAAVPQRAHAEPTPPQLKAIGVFEIRNYIIKGKVTLTKSHETYKVHFDKRSRSVISVAEVDEIYLDRPPRYEIPEEKKSYSKLLARTLGPFRVLEVLLNTVKIGHSCLKDVVNKDKVSKTPLASKTPIYRPVERYHCRPNHSGPAARYTPNGS